MPVEKLSIVDKVDAVTLIGEERFKAGGVQPPPKSVKIEITGRCNLRCKYCGLATRKEQPKHDMAFDFFRRITEDMRLAGVEEIGVFYLGESFMAPELLVKCIDWCKNALGFPWVFLTSNATIARPEIVREVMLAGLDSLKWSANFRSARHFNAVTGCSSKLWGHAIDHIQRAFDIRSELQAKTILSASSIIFYDEEELKKQKSFIDRYVAPFVDRHYWLPTYQMGMENEKVAKKFNIQVGGGNTGRIDEGTMRPNRAPFPCWAVFTEGHVRVDGGLSACCFGADETFDMGKLTGEKFNFMNVWNSAAFLALRRSHLATLISGPGELKRTPCHICIPKG